jgi:hypothetical protein
MTSDTPARRNAPGASLLQLAVVCAILGSGGCASAPPAEPREYLDESTAATVTLAGRSIVFALERPDLGVNARDYVTLTGVDVNTSGLHVSHVIGYAWSTLDKRSADGDAQATYELVVDDRVLPLTVMTAGFRSLGLATPPLQPPSRSAVPLAAKVSREALALYVDSPTARVVRQRAGVTERFQRWSVTATR